MSSPADRRLRSGEEVQGLRFDAAGLIPVVAQDAATGSVLMVAWANQEALELTLESGEMHYWSRSRGALWRKGATSGNTQRLRTLHADCDGDTVLARVEPAGPACHTGDPTCFGLGALAGEGDGAAREEPGSDVVSRVWEVLKDRDRERPEGSYTTRLLSDENLRLKKLGEEVAELITALARREEDRIPEEAADLLYHLLVALLGAGVSLDRLHEVLERRRG